MDGRDGETEELSVETDEVQPGSPRGCTAPALSTILYSTCSEPHIGYIYVWLFPSVHFQKSLPYSTSILCSLMCISGCCFCLCIVCTSETLDGEGRIIKDISVENKLKES